MSAVESPTPSPAPAPEPRTCPRCGAPLVPGQEWCLSCGADTGSELADTPRWRGPIAIAAVLATLIVAGLVLAFLELSDGGEPVSRAPTPSPAPVEPGPGASGSPAPSPTPSPGAEVTPTPSPGAEASPTPGGEVSPTPSPGAEETPAPGATATPDSTSQVGEWPEGETAYTVIVKSSRSRSAAERAAEDLASQGKDAGVLRSDDFSSLNPGYWVAFVGQYDSASQARSEAESIGGGAYPRRVVPE
jgi:SPOR domain